MSEKLKVTIEKGIERSPEEISMKQDLQMNLLKRLCLGDALKRSALREPKKEALVYSYKGNITHRLTYEDLNKMANRFGNALLKMGVEKGEILAIISHNCTHFFVYSWASRKIGAIECPLNVALRGREITDLINHAEPKILFVEDELVEHIKGLSKEMPSVEAYIMINLKKEIKLPEGWIDCDELISDKYSDTEPEVIINGNDPYQLLYTSGTEAMPKGVVLSHSNSYSAAMAIISDRGLTWHRNEVALLPIPLFHTAALCTTISGIINGIKIVMQYGSDVNEMISLIRGEKATATGLPPAMLVNFLSLEPNIKESLKQAMKSLRKIIIFGAAISEPLWKRIMEFFPDVEFINTYAQSENSPTITFLHHQNIITKTREAYEKYGGAEPVGIPCNNVELKIFDDNDNEVPPGTLGGFVVRGPLVMLGYYKEPEKTADVFKNGWLHTGDLGIMDEEGCFYFVDRQKDIVKTGGENVSSFEVEQEIMHHSKILQAGVVGLPHPKWGEAITAFVVPNAGENPTEEEIIKHCKERIAGYKVPKKVVFLSAIPTNPSGKMLKKELREKYKDLYSG